MGQSLDDDNEIHQEYYVLTLISWAESVERAIQQL
jgi:hypothetical protein